ncbi:MAG: type 4a pilus biogenesis protein PilO [Candidatus Omnitrophota bacterium]
MKIANFELTKKNLPIAVSVSMAAILLSAYMIFYIPLAAAVRAKYSDCRRLESEVIRAGDIVNNAGKISNDRMLLTEKDTSLAIDELTRQGKEDGITFHSIKPSEMAMDEDNQYKILNINMDIEANDKNLASFIGSLDELEKGLIRIRSFDILPLKKDRTILKAELAIDMYFSMKEYE